MRIISLLFFRFGVLGCVLAAQAPPTFVALLEEQGVKTDTASLRLALQSAKPDIRGLAASELAARKDLDAIPSMQVAESHATDGYERLNIAEALLTLQAQNSPSIMKGLCFDQNLEDKLRIQAAQFLTTAGNNGCLPAVLTILERAGGWATSVNAISYLAGLKNLPPSESAAATKALGHALQNSDASVRLRAAECIAALRLEDAIPLLRQQEVLERDPQVLKKLKKTLYGLNRQKEQRD